MRNDVTICDTDVKSASLLIVDDEPTNVKVLSKTLQLEGYTSISSIVDPREVYDACMTHEFDLILLDLNMPHLNGFQVMEQLFSDETYRPPPILVLTAQDAQEFKSRALGSGARDYVTKPFDVVELLARVRNMINIQLAEKYLRNQNEILEQKVQQRTHELHTTRLQVVRRLGRAAEYRDNETGLHIIRMSKISELLGRKYGLSNYECDLLLNASPMHDIGKIGIPDNILLKPGKFEPEEWEVMKTHAEIGADILNLRGDSTDLMRMAHDIALYHHEKWDGSGYPKGLSGEAIPLTARIVAIADVFDALTSERPYKKAWPVDEAIQYMRDQRGKHFDPKLLDIFLDHLDTVMAIRARHAEPQENP